MYLLINSEREFDGEVFQNVPADVAVLRLLRNLGSIVESFETPINPTQATRGGFFGPIEFVGEYNREIAATVSNGSVTRIVQFRNLDGDGRRELREV